MASSRGRGSLRRGPLRFPFVVILSKGVSEKGVVFQRRWRYQHTVGMSTSFPGRA